MAFSSETVARIPEWVARKQAQWERVQSDLPGLQFIRSGERGTECLLTYSPHDGSFYESVIVGQLPHVALEPYGSKLNPRFRDMANDKKPLEKREIDLDDDEIDRVIRAWKAGRSALTLRFVPLVYGVDGKIKLRT